ncbi:N-6 DNA methylase [Neiella sp. HB171785]|uniref:N-6 DNA methylase n=1 Tax=Neiella litorisoli TaxID=2771431 RepID=A0A8J6QUG5_9GAMM|nr:N-6 DNA methylase [Neiella litorisoli]MBD1388978.1 N-6 DNA methylase [Neiella litorisoli]
MSDATTKPQGSLESLVKQYQEQGFSEFKPLNSEHEFVDAGLIWGIVEGNQTPSILAINLEQGHWEYSNEDKLDELAYELLTEVEGDWPVFACLTDPENARCYALFGLDGTDGTHSVDEIPSVNLISEYKRLKEYANLRWSKQVQTRLMHKLDAFHEQVYQTVKDRVSDKNDIIEEVAKILFLETFRVHHDADLTFDFKGEKLKFREVFDHNYVKEHGTKAVEQIQAAFDEFKKHEDYIIVTDSGAKVQIFDDKTHLRLEQPENYRTLLEAIQDLGPVKNNEGKIVPGKVFEDKGTLADVAGDMLGRVFDVFLRANFESKGGLGVYLTPNPVKQAMLEMVFEDILKDAKTVEEITAGLFRFCDPTCGSFGFGSVALSRMDALVDTELALGETEKADLKQLLRDQAFVGADAAPRMVMLARVNMALQGAPKAQIFYTDNSLTSPSLKPNSFNLICTNPPFGTPKFKNDKRGKESKAQYEAMMEQTLGGFRDAELKTVSYNAYYDHLKKEWQDVGELHTDDDGNPIWPGYRTDLRNVSTGKKAKYELYPTTSGLALGSKPNKKGEWNQVKGGSIDPAVLFIDRCLQLLKPGGRLMIVLPDGILCNSGDSYVREYIMGKKDAQTGEFVGGKAIVKAVVSLPTDTFKLSGTGAKTSILYLQKRKAREDDPELFLPEPQTDVFMAVAETLGYVVKNNVEDYSAGVSNDLDKIVGAYKRGE